MNNKECEKELRIALAMVKKQTHQLSVLKNGLERLRHDNSWQSVEEVNSFIDRLLEAKE